ncbi:MAG TPA: hypothetical protein VD973_25680 [Symbiobacteriaceae bacterium]|nr:hypothetical protein [Symbiobacteriaceae bacterium]
MLDKLHLVLQYSIVNGRLTLGVTSPLPPEASKLLRAVPGRTLDLREASLELTGAGEAAVLKISGAVSGWPVQQNPRVTLEGARLSMIIGIPRADGATEVRLEVRGQLRSDAMTADVQGTLTGSTGRWQLTAGSVQAADIGSVLAAVWGAGHMQPLPADALSAMQFAGIERLAWEWDPEAPPEQVFPVHIEGTGTLFGVPCHLTLKGGPADLAMKAALHPDLRQTLQGKAGEALQALLADATADLRDWEGFKDQVTAQGRRTIDRLTRLPGELTGRGWDWLAAMKNEAAKLSKQAVQERLDQAAGTLPPLQERLTALEAGVEQIRAQVAAEEAADAPSMAAAAVTVYQDHLGHLQSEVNKIKEEIIAALQALEADTPRISVVMEMLTIGPKLMALLGARQTARQEMQALALQLQYLQQNEDGPVQLPAHLHPRLMAAVVERNLLRRQVNTEQAVENALRLITSAWPQTINDLIRTVPLAAKALADVVEASLGDLRHWGREIAAIQAAMAGTSLFRIDAVTVASPVATLQPEAKEVVVDLVVQGQAKETPPVRLLSDLREPLTGADRLAKVILERLMPKPAA